MTLRQLVLQLLFVVVGVFVYDQFVRPEPPPPVRFGHVVPWDRLQERERSEEALPSAPSLAGTEASLLRRRLADLAQRLDEVEAAVRARPPVGPAEPNEGRPRPLPPLEPRGTEGAVSITAEDLDRFRALQAAVQRERQAERVQHNVARVLDALEVPLRADERSEVIDAAMDAWWGASKAQESHRPNTASEGQLRAQLERQLETLRDAVGGILGDARAETVTTRLARAIGLSPALRPSDEDRAPNR